MLIWTRARAKPCIICHVEKPMRSIADCDDLVREYRLERNERANWRKSGETDRAWAVTGGEVDIALGDFRNTQQRAEGYELAERNQMVFIVHVSNMACRIDRCEAVPYPERLLSLRRDAIIPRNEQALLRHYLSNARTGTRIVP